jgi:hypothetical protein
VPPKKQIITIFGILGVVAFGLGYWDGMPEKDSGQRAEVVTPTVVTNVVTNTLREVVTNIVRVPAPLPVKPPVPEFNPIIEAKIRSYAKKPTGELTKADYLKVTTLMLNFKQLSDVKGLEKLTQLEKLYLTNNPDLTKAQIDELQKALPKCNISSNPTK